MQRPGMRERLIDQLLNRYKTLAINRLNRGGRTNGFRGLNDFLIQANRSGPSCGPLVWT